MIDKRDSAVKSIKLHGVAKVMLQFKDVSKFWDIDKHEGELYIVLLNDGSIESRMVTYNPDIKHCDFGFGSIVGYAE